MEEIIICENGVMRPATEAELAQMVIDEQNYQTNELPKIVRTERNNLLKQSDWTQVPDAPVNKEEWAIYRQALRDITNQSGFPTDVVFPTPPQ
jgi:hypothetical protein